MIQVIALVFAALAFVTFAGFRLRRYLHIFQQEEYDPHRFLRWLLTARTYDKRLSVALGAITLLSWISGNPWPITLYVLIGVAFGTTAALEPNPEKAAKKKLVMTQRASRIFRVAFGLSAVLALIVSIALPTPLTIAIGLIAATQLLPFLLVAANGLLAPVERNIQAGFRKRAENRLREVAPTVIGITGSFGKTSVKHILGHILQMTTNTLFTPGSVNTVMGISRIINERLEDNCRYFIVEMGAYGMGSIARLCDFTPPDHGIITSIGAAHYERFKDLDTVARAKFELAEAVRQKDGRLTIHESVLDQPFARSFVEGDRARFQIVGTGPDTDIRIEDVEQQRDGLHVRLAHAGATRILFAPLFGLHHGHNMALAFAFALDRGVAPDRIVQALRSTPQIAHRLALTKHSSGALYLDDAYNSNPDGFANALSLLDQLRAPGGRRILVTPGMAELGAKHDAMHAEIGRKAARTTDITAVIKPERVPTLIDAIEASGGETRIERFNRFTDAQTWLNMTLQPDDVVLIENDLPDLYERPFRT